MDANLDALIILRQAQAISDGPYGPSIHRSACIQETSEFFRKLARLHKELVIPLAQELENRADEFCELPEIGFHPDRIRMYAGILRAQVRLQK